MMNHEKEDNGLITPLYLVSSGRSGTTLLMRHMAGHPNVILRNLYPYETRTSQYLYRFQKLGLPREHILYATEKIRYLPYQPNDGLAKQWHKEIRGKTFEDLYLDMSSHFYKFLSIKEHKRNVKIYMEKAIGLETIRDIGITYDRAQFLLLIRDPRDIYFSIKAFNKKRGYPHFGEERGARSMFEGIVRFYRDANTLFERFGARGETIRYENLIENPFDILDRIAHRFDLERNDELYEKLIGDALMDDRETLLHKTTASTIGRWVAESKPFDLDIFEKYEQDIASLGYSV